MAHIYKIINKINSKIYIGSSKNYKNRWIAHKWELRKGTHANKYLQKSWNKYGEENFEFLLIEECEDEYQFDREQYYLDLLLPFSPNGYNIAKTAGVVSVPEGENHPFAKLTNEQVIKIKESLANGEKQKYIVNNFNISWGIIGKIASLDSWKDVGEEYNEKILNLQRNKWTNDMEEKLLELRDEEGLTFKEISEILGLHYSALMKRYRDLKGINKYKNCERCGKKIKVHNNSQKYCKKCASEKERERKRNYMKKLRS